MNAKYITYFYNEAHRHNLNVNKAASSFFKQKEYIDLGLKTSTASEQDRYIVKSFRRRKGILRHNQLEIKDEFDELAIRRASMV